MSKPYLKLKEVKTITVEKIVKKIWKRWDEAQKKYWSMDTNPQGTNWKQEGWQMKWVVECAECIVELSHAQFISLLGACFTIYEGVANPKGKTFKITTSQSDPNDPKTIRYYFSYNYEQKKVEEKKEEYELLNNILSVEPF